MPVSVPTRTPAKTASSISMAMLIIFRLNSYFKIMGKSAVEILLLKILHQIHLSNSKIVEKYAKNVENSVNEDGTVDYKKLSIATSMISFEYYQSMEGHDGVLLLNIPNFTFIYCPAGDASGFGELVNNGKINPASAISFKDSSDGAMSFKIN